MKLLLENWRKLLKLKEGEVIQFPRQPKISEGDLQLVIQIEYQVAERLAELHGNMASIPIEKLEQLEQLMDNLEELLKA